ncbi:MAG: hypothetical protein WAV56_02490 [Microgenomates group bacterium]
MTKKIEDLTRHEIRYLCFRLQTEADGGNPATKESEGILSLVDRIKDHFEDQDDFGGWRNFAKTWDVDHKSYLVAVKRVSSIHSEWNHVLKKQTHDLPTAPKKLLTNELAQKVQEKKNALAKKRRSDDEV